MNDAKRNHRGYKTTDKVYKDAMKQAKRDKRLLAQIIEATISIYGSIGHWPSWDEIEYKLDRGCVE